ncbi:MAG: ABC transporter ATP-binding protein [Thermoguttaceae bacterium]|nr:ABC transporter ATP-binding protein [Thermoguttaceae bacterium]
MTEPADSSSLMLRAENLTKQFQQGRTVVDALCEANISVTRGDFVAVMGASGSGKSTLLHLMAGLTTPSAGRVEIDGADLFAMSDRALTLFRRRRIGLVFQAYNLVPALTTEQNIMLPVLMESSGRNHARQLDELIERLGLAQRRKHRPDELSGGEQQRVAIARALISDPAVVLADEPTGNVDSVAGQGICRLLRDLCNDQGRTIVMVTHEAAVAVWAKRIVVLKDGRVVDSFLTAQFGDTDALATHYQNVVAAADTGEGAE